MREDSQDKINQLKNAIATLESQRATLGDTVVEASLDALRKQLAELEGELEPPDVRKKMVSLLFMDIVESTKLGQHLEPDEILEIMDGALRRLATNVEEFGGRVTRFMGDGFKAVFGEPVARENDAEMAVRAGLGILEDTKKIARDLQERWNITGFNVRVGVNTGMVAVGGFTESVDTMMGLPVNLGARLESAAPPGGLLISLSTYQHVRRIFEIDPMKPVKAKGFDGEVEVYLVKSAKPSDFHTKTRGIEGISIPMIGRDAELKRLQDAYYTAIEEDECQVITALGEAGVGKSRLLDEFDSWLENESNTKIIMKGRSNLETQDSPYALLRDMFARGFQIQDNDPVYVVHQKFEDGMGKILGNDENTHVRAHFIGQLLGFDFKESPFLQGVLDDTQQLRDRAWNYLAEYCKVASTRAPLIIFLEDIHWADDSSLDVISYLTQSLSQHSFLIVCLARAVFLERRPHWGEGQRSYSRIELHPLSTRECRHLVEEILRKMDQVPLALRELVVNGADGNPFYIEELIKMLIDSGVIITGSERWQVDHSLLAGILADMDVPTTLTSLLQARLENLAPEERKVLQQASVVGRIFWDESIKYINVHSNGDAVEGKEIPDFLARLRGKEMIFHRETSALSGAEEYIFKHAVLRDVVYDTTLKKERQAYHAMVADWLIDETAERSGELTGMIGEHLQSAGQTSRAVSFLRQAGEQAAQQYANDQAIKYLSRALELTPAEDTSERYAILLAREQVFSLLGARESQNQDLEQLVKLTEALNDESKRGEVSLLQAVQAAEKSDYPTIISQADKAILVARETQNAQLEVKGYLLWGRALLSQGDYEGAEERFNQALTTAQSHELVRLEADSLRNLGIVDERLGKGPTAIDYFERSLQLYQQSGDRRGEGQTLNQLGNILLLQGDYRGGKQYYEQFLGISREIGDRWGEGQVVRNIADIFLSTYDYRGASKYFEEALQITREIGNRTIESSALVGMGNVYLEQAEYTKAKTLFEQSLNIAREIGNKPWEAKTLSQIGRYFHWQGDYVRAQSYYEQSLEIYRLLGNQLSQGRVLADLSLLYHHLGDDASAKETSESALIIAEELNHPNLLGRSLMQLGRAQAGMGQHNEALDSYQRAGDIFQDLGQQNLLMEVFAGVSLVHITNDDQSKALELAEKIIHHLENSQAPEITVLDAERGAIQQTETGAVPGLEGTSDPLWIYLTCYRVLKANGDDRAADILSAALKLLRAQASKIEDADLQYSFLNNVKVNREIQAESAAGGTV